MGLSAFLRRRFRNDAKFLKRWTKIRQRGYWRFIIDRCAIMSVAYSLSYFVTGWMLGRERDLTVMIASGVGYVIGILLFGPWHWGRAEERFHRLTGQEAAKAFD